MNTNFKLCSVAVLAGGLMLLTGCDNENDSTDMSRAAGGRGKSSPEARSDDTLPHFGERREFVRNDRSEMDRHDFARNDDRFDNTRRENRFSENDRLRTERPGVAASDVQSNTAGRRADESIVRDQNNNIPQTNRYDASPDINTTPSNNNNNSANNTAGRGASSAGNHYDATADTNTAPSTNNAGRGTVTNSTANSADANPSTQNSNTTGQNGTTSNDNSTGSSTSSTPGNTAGRGPDATK